MQAVVWQDSVVSDQPPSTTTTPERKHRLSDGQALGLLGAWLIFRQITARIGLSIAPRASVRIGKPWLIPLLTNAPPNLILAGTGASGSWPKIVLTMIASVLLSTIIGLIFYWAGARFGEKLAQMAQRPGSPWAGIWNPKQIARAERWMDRWGILVVFIGRATEHFTLPITLVAGASEMRIRRFLAAHTAGAIAFAGLFVWIGSYAHRRWPGLEHWITDTYAPWAARIGIGLLVVMVVLLTLGWALDRGKSDEQTDDDPVQEPDSTTTPSQPSSDSPPENA